jgi:hypothetical protein
MSLERAFINSIKNSINTVLDSELNELKRKFAIKHGFRGKTEDSMKFKSQEVKGDVSYQLRSRRVRSQSGELIDLILLLDEGTEPYFSPVSKLRPWVRAKFGITRRSDLNKKAYAVSRQHSIEGNPVRSNRGWFSSNFDESQLTAKIDNKITSDLINLDVNI